MKRTPEQDATWVACVTAQCAYLRACGWDHDGSGLWLAPWDKDRTAFVWDLDFAVKEQNLRFTYGEAPPPTADVAPGATNPEPWTHPFVVGLAVDALCAFCGKTVAEHAVTPETLDELQARAALRAVGYDARGIEHAISSPVAALAEVDRNLASRFARRDILRAYARGRAHRGSH